MLPVEFSYCPDGAVPRLIRFVNLEEDNLLSKFDNSINLLLIDETLYDKLPDLEQQLLLKTMMTRTYFHPDPPRVEWNGRENPSAV